MEIPEARALVEEDDRVVEVLEEEEGVGLGIGPEVVEGVGVRAAFDGYREIAGDEVPHPRVELGGLLRRNGTIVVEEMVEARADGHARDEASADLELAGRDGEEEAERASVGGRSLGGRDRDRFHAAVHVDLGIEGAELVVHEDRGEGPGQLAHPRDEVGGLDPDGVSGLVAARVGDGDLLHRSSRVASLKA
jgi:hypothetical protein